MTEGLSALLFVVAIVVCVILANKTGINIGIPAMICAYAIGCIGLGMKVKEVYSLWNLNLQMSYIGVVGMFYFAKKSGAMENVGKKLLYSVRKTPWLLCPMFFLIGTILSFIGSDVAAILSLMAALSFSFAADLGIHPMCILASVGIGAGSGSLVPWSPNGLLVGGFLEGFYDADTVNSMIWKSEGSMLICQFLICIIICAIFGGFKINGGNFIKPEPMTKEQKTALAIPLVSLAIVIVLATLKSLVGGVFTTLAGIITTQTISLVAILVEIMIGLGKSKDLVNNGIPWGIILLSGGLMCLVSVANKGGMPHFIASLIEGNVPAGIVAPVLCLAGGVMSIFAGATTTVFTTLMAIAVPVAAAMNLSPAFLCAAILSGAMTTAVSPFSTGGALILSFNTIPEWEEGNKLFKNEIYTAFGGLIVPVIFAALGLMFK